MKRVLIFLRNIAKKGVNNAGSFAKKVFLLFKKGLKNLLNLALNKFDISRLKPKTLLKFSLFFFVGLIIVMGIIYVILEYKQISYLVKNADSLVKNERYDDATKDLELAWNSWPIKVLGIKKQSLSEKIEEIKNLNKDKIQYELGLAALNMNNFQEAIDLLSQLSEESLYYQKSQTRIEEAKRKIVEGKLSKEETARKLAETKAKQQEFEKKLKEQQLADKETEEKMMNTDNDGDGLTYRRELELKTSDWSTDSDGDGIIDSLDSHPAGGGRNQAQTFAWSYAGNSWTWTEFIQEDWYDYYKGKPRSSPESTNYITSNDPFIKKIAQKISAVEKPGTPKTWLAVSFVQSLSYVDDVYTGYDEYPKYPIETFFEKNGDCEDTSYLAASIIDAMNIGSVLVLLPSHMAVGVWMDCGAPGTYYKLNDRCYYYVETTGEGWSAGEIPDKYRYTPTTLIEVPFGRTFKNISPQYNKPCISSVDFPGYYSDGSKFYSDGQCNNQVTCLSYSGYFWSTMFEKFYHDSSCTQEVVKGCTKSTSFPGYFFDGYNWYYDSRCSQIYYPYGL